MPVIRIDRIVSIFRFSLIVVSLSIILSCTKQTTAKAKKPNIVLINTDDLGWKDLGFMGSSYYETPNLDALAQQGMVFTQAYAGAANCAPSRACLLSGLNTPRHGVYTVSPSERGNEKTRRLIPIKNTAHLSDTIYTLPQMLKSAGYITGSFGKWHVGQNPMEQGIDVNIGGSSRGSPGKEGYFSPYNIQYLENGPEGEYLTDRLTHEAISFITKNKDTAFFVYLPYYTVHTPIMAKADIVKKFESKKGSDGQDNPTYAAMISALDENVGKIMEKLETLDLLENTLLIFTSDNGGIRDVSHQDPLRAGKGSYYEGGIRVPLIMRWQGHIPPGTINQNRVSNLDLYPTLQEIAQPKKKMAGLDGKSLVAQLKEPSPMKRDLFFHFPIYLQAYNPKEDNGRDPLFRTRPGSVIISGDWKLHEYFEDGGLELYNLKTDPGERQNLTGSHPEKTNELLDKLREWRKNQKAPIPTNKNPMYDSIFEGRHLVKVMER